MLGKTGMTVHACLQPVTASSQCTRIRFMTGRNDNNMAARTSWCDIKFNTRHCQTDWRVTIKAPLQASGGGGWCLGGKLTLTGNRKCTSTFWTWQTLRTAIDGFFCLLCYSIIGSSTGNISPWGGHLMEKFKYGWNSVWHEINLVADMATFKPAC